MMPGLTSVGNDIWGTVMVTGWNLPEFVYEQRPGAYCVGRPPAPRAHSVRAAA